MENVAYPMTYYHGMEISLVNGNNKVGKGVWCFNMLPGDKPLSNSTKGVLTNINGTCGGCCDGCANACYAIRDGKLHHNACIPAWGKKTLIRRNDIESMFSQLKRGLIKNKAKVLRWHSAGEIESFNYLLHMVKLAIEMPQVQFYCYTKRFDFVTQYLRDYKRFPKNLVVNISVWNDNDKGYDFGRCNKFVYDDGSDPKIAKMRHCPAVDKNGHSTGIKCSQCGWCFKGNFGRITAVYSH